MQAKSFGDDRVVTAEDELDTSLAPSTKKGTTPADIDYMRHMAATTVSKMEVNKKKIDQFNQQVTSNYKL